MLGLSSSGLKNWGSSLGVMFGLSQAWAVLEKSWNGIQAHTIQLSTSRSGKLQNKEKSRPCKFCWGHGVTPQLRRQNTVGKGWARQWMHTALARRRQPRVLARLSSVKWWPEIVLMSWGEGRCRCQVPDCLEDCVHWVNVFLQLRQARRSGRIHRPGLCSYSKLGFEE